MQTRFGSLYLRLFNVARIGPGCAAVKQESLVSIFGHRAQSRDEVPDAAKIH